MLQFIKKIIIFLIPVALFFLLPFTVFILSREYYSPGDVVAIQSEKENVLYGMAYSSSWQSYKKALVIEKDPEVVSLGASRVMEFRKEFFKKPEKFVNAGGGISTLGQMEQFIKDLPVGTPIKLIILDVDPDMFKSATSSSIYETPETGELATWLEEGWKRIYRDYFSGKFGLKNLHKKSVANPSIGLNALIKNNGFRGDGSYKYGEISARANHANTLSAENALALEFIRQDRRSFIYPEVISPVALVSVQNILRLAKERGIFVVGFSPPYPQEFYKEIVSKEDAYKKMATLLPLLLTDTFSEYGFPYHDFSNAKMVNAKETEFADSKHGTDKLYARMSLYMAQRNKNLEQYFDLPALQEMIKNAEGDFLNF